MIRMKIDTTELEKAFGRAAQVPEAAAEEAYRYFVRSTPIKTGRARSNTEFDQNKKTITGNYAYAERLDDGYSKQAPRGMTDPTIEFYEKRVNELIRKIP